MALLYKNDGGNSRTVPLEVRHADGSSLTFQVPFDVPVGKAQTRLVTVRSRVWGEERGVLKPGKYTATSKLGTVEKTVSFNVYPDQHPNAYWTAQWAHHGESWETTQAKGGWMYMNSDLATLHPRKPAPGDLAESYVAARMRPFQRMVLGGGHQLDLELVNDWGDPWVQRTIAWRMQLAALSNRLYPLAGLHCYDEPGLTWWPIKGPDGKVIENNPFVIPHQLEEFTKLTGKKMPQGRFAEIAPQYAKRMDDWLAFADMRMKYLEQAWYATVWGTNSVEPKFATINQVSSSYAPGTTTDGVDSRQNRAYPIVSGHGGYSDLPFGTMQPVRSAEAFRGFGWDRPHYFLPMWYTHSWATMRNAIWMSWTTRLDGLMYTPEQDFAMDMAKHGYHGTHTIFEIAEINRRLALVGDAIRQLPRSPAPVAVLHSHRQFAHDIATVNSPELHKIGSPQYASPHRAAVDACFFRVMEQGIAPNWIDEVEAAEKGVDFLKQWKCILCPRLATASPAFRKALEGYIAAGGKLIQFQGDKLLLKGSIVASHQFGDPTQYYLENVKNDYLSPANRDLSWRKWNNDLAPTFAKDLAAWIGPQPYECSNKEILLGVHGAGKVTYLLFANNAQSKENPRGVKHELIPAETTVTLPPTGVVYDLFNGGRVPVKNGTAKLRLAAGDGACWLHVRQAIKRNYGGCMSAESEHGPMQWSVWQTYRPGGPIPVRIRLDDPAGNRVLDLIRATGAKDGKWVSDTFVQTPLNAEGKWKLEVSEWYAGTPPQLIDPPSEDKGRGKLELAAVSQDSVSVYFDDTRRIVDLFAGKPFEPPYDKLNWDSKRVFGLDPKKFAVFGPEAAAKKLADALKAKGMKVEVNPKYEIKPFVREPGRGGAGVSHGVGSNLENIYAHTIVLPGHALATQSQNRGHINRPVTPVFPGPDRAYLQWGIGCYQAGWQNVFVLGDTDAGVTWLLGAIAGKAPAAKPIELRATVKVVPAVKPAFARALTIARQIKAYDTPVGIGTSPDGKITYVALYDGSVIAHDADGKELWTRQALLEGCDLAVSPKGDRLAVAGYPGLLVLDCKDGKVIGGHRTAPVEKGHTIHANRMVGLAWNSAGTLVAGGWLNPDPKMALAPVVLDAQGQALPPPQAITGSVMGAVFVPNSNVLLLGADQLTAVRATDGTVLWRNPIKGAQAFAFSADGKTGAAGGWGKKAGTFSLTDGKVIQSADFPAVVGGVALLPGGDLVVAVWGGTKPLSILRGAAKAEPFFASHFGFQNVVWSEAHRGLIAAEQGGKLWLLDE